MHLVGDLDRVRPRLFLNDEGDTLLVVDPGDRPFGLEAVVDDGEILEVDGVAADVGHDDAQHLRDARKLRLGPDQEILGLLGQPAGRHVEIFTPDGLSDLGDREALGVEPSQVDLDLNLPLQSADDIHCPNPVHLLDQRLDLVLDERSDGREAHLAVSAQDSERDDRRRLGVELIDDRLDDLAGKRVPDSGDLFPDFGSGHLGFLSRTKMAAMIETPSDDVEVT